MRKSNAAKLSSRNQSSNSKHSNQKTAKMSEVEMDKLIHERKRLAIISTLAVNPSLTFNELKSLLDLSDGNLSVHAQKLEAADYIRCVKSFEGRTPRTTFSITKKGTKALEKYLDHMEKLIRTVRTAQE